MGVNGNAKETCGDRSADDSIGERHGGNPKEGDGVPHTRREKRGRRSGLSPNPQPHPTTSMTSSLDLLKASGTVVVSDSGDFESIAVYQPQDVRLSLFFSFLFSPFSFFFPFFFFFFFSSISFFFSFN